ncbi:MAG: hypothetical protein DMG09_28860 [Acidobacteria bacterium]|nr:MAG: hypothetical protein DMG09_28860 [Acidobacteriota bacterium]
MDAITVSLATNFLSRHSRNQKLGDSSRLRAFVVGFGPGFTTKARRITKPFFYESKTPAEG